jgi:predicted CopG family antitoxin
MSISRKKTILSMEEVFVALKHMQQENQSFRESIAHL